MRCLGVFLALAAGGLQAQPFSVAPRFLDFGNVLVGCNASLTFTVTPSAPLTFLLQAPGAPFSVSPTTFTTQTAVTVRFSPSSPGSFSGISINLLATDAQGREVGRDFVILSAAGVEVVASPPTIDFGLVPVGATSTPQSVRFTLAPSGPFNFQVSTASSSPAFSSTPGSSASEAQITFRPTSAGPASGTITFTLTSPATPSCPLTRTVTVRGTGVTVNLAVNPTALSFGGAPIGTTSAAKTATISNNSTIDFTGTASSSNAAFVITPASFTVDAGKAADFNVTFTAPAAGQQSGTITFTLNSAGSFSTTLTLRVSGQGQAPADLAVSPESIDFGDVGVGSSAARSVRISNPGGIDAEVTGSTRTPFSLSTSSFTVAAGGSQLVNVGFAPSSATAFQATATFVTGSITRTIALAGRGVAPSFSFTFSAGLEGTPVSPGGTIPFPPTSVGSTYSVQFQISNTGSVPGSVNSFGATGTAFGIVGSPSLPVSLSPGSSLLFTIRFRPDSPGSNEAVLGIDGRSFNLVGTGLIAAAAISGTGVAVSPVQQRTLGVTISQSSRVAVTGRLALSFSPGASGGDDPAIEFASGGRSVAFTIPANSVVALFGSASQIGFQTGTVAGTIEFRAVFDVSGLDVTPVVAPTGSVTIARAAPVITRLTASRTAGGFQAVVVGYATSREVNGLEVQLAPASGANLTTTRLSAEVANVFRSWYGSEAAVPFGSLFTLTIPFTVQGDVNNIRSISVTLSNGDGNSQTVEGVLSP